jgi:hypothetical protein
MTAHSESPGKPELFQIEVIAPASAGDLVKYMHNFRELRISQARSSPGKGTAA